MSGPYGRRLCTVALNIKSTNTSLVHYISNCFQLLFLMLPFKTELPSVRNFRAQQKNRMFSTFCTISSNQMICTTESWLSAQQTWLGLCLLKSQGLKLLRNLCLQTIGGGTGGAYGPRPPTFIIICFISLHF